VKECVYCGTPCDPSIGAARRLTTTIWPERRVEEGPTIVMFFCSKDHRNIFLTENIPGGTVQARHIGGNGED
jgi:hypothetical protein